MTANVDQPSRDRLNNFNLIRLMGAFGVLFFHVYVITGTPGEPLAFTKWLNFGNLSVRMFFVVSGFLLTDSLRRNPDLVSWSIARILRIWPALIVCTIFCIVVLGPAVTNSADYWVQPVTFSYAWSAAVFQTRAVLPGVFMTNPIPVVNGSLWTLPYEVFWYMALAVLTLVFRGRLRLGLLIAYCACSWIVLNGYAVQYVLFGNVNFFGVVELGPFFIGGALMRFVRSRGHLLLDAAMVIALCATIYFPGQDWRPFYAAEVVAFPYLFIRIATSQFRPLAVQLSKLDISYGVFLYSFPMTQTAVLYLGKDAGILTTTLVSVALTCPLAMISWFLVEKPALRLRSVLRARNRGTGRDAALVPA